MNNTAHKIPEILVNKITLMSYGLNPHPTAKIMKKVYKFVEEWVDDRMYMYCVDEEHYDEDGVKEFYEKIKNYGRHWDIDLCWSYHEW